MDTDGGPHLWILKNIIKEYKVFILAFCLDSIAVEKEYFPV